MQNRQQPPIKLPTSVPPSPATGGTEEPETGVLPDRYKTQLCRSYEKIGTCLYGDKCAFAHGQSDLRTVEQNRAAGKTRRPVERQPNHDPSLVATAAAAAAVLRELDGGASPEDALAVSATPSALRPATGAGARKNRGRRRASAATSVATSPATTAPELGSPPTSAGPGVVLSPALNGGSPLPAAASFLPPASTHLRPYDDDKTDVNAAGTQRQLPDDALALPARADALPQAAALPSAVADVAAPQQQRKLSQAMPLSPPGGIGRPAASLPSDSKTGPRSPPGVGYSPNAFGPVPQHRHGPRFTHDPYNTRGLVSPTLRSPAGPGAESQ